jgi:hypothetical protein
MRFAVPQKEEGSERSRMKTRIKIRGKPLALGTLEVPHIESNPL